MDRRYLAVGVFILGLCAGLGYHYLYEKPTETQYINEKIEVPKLPLEGKPITIGYISPTNQHLETSIPFINQIIVPDLQHYLDTLGHDNDIEIDTHSADRIDTIHLEKVQELKSKDINLFIGGFSDYMFLETFQYVNDNEMLMVSPSSYITEEYAIPDDNLYRLSNSNEYEAKMLAEIIWSKGVKAVVVFYDISFHSKNIFTEFNESYSKFGGKILASTRTGVDIYPASWINYLEEVASEEFPKYDAKETGFVLLSSHFFTSLVKYTPSYNFPTILNTTWFGYGCTNFTKLCEELTEESIQVKLFTPKRVLPKSMKYLEMNQRYYELTGRPLDYPTACTFDAAWLIVESIIRSQSMEASNVSHVFPVVAENYYGVSGWTRLNEAGDRYGADYEIWGYKLENGICTPYIVGFYDSHEEITWYDR
jgi:branched-chain amino acid transport system substrate-binding protein